MSLTVRIVEFRLPKAKTNLIGRVEFRGEFTEFVFVNSLNRISSVRKMPLAKYDGLLLHISNSMRFVRINSPESMKDKY